MYNNYMEERKKLPVSILTICIIQIIFALGEDALMIFGKICAVSVYEGMKEVENFYSTTNAVTVSIISIGILVGCGFILAKKKIGIIFYFTSIVINFIMFFVLFGVGSICCNVFNLILPVLMLIFVIIKYQVFE